MEFEKQLEENQNAHLKKMNKNYRGTFYIVDQSQEESKEAESVNHEKMSDHNPINDNDDQ